MLRGTLTFGGSTLTGIARHHAVEGFGGHLSVMLGGSQTRRTFERAATPTSSGIVTALPLAMIEAA